MLNAVETRLLKRGVNLPQGEIGLEGFLAELDESDLGNWFDEVDIRDKIEVNPWNMLSLLNFLANLDHCWN